MLQYHFRYHDANCSKVTMASLTTTSYAILGLLTLRAWSAYDLARQMARLHDIWPRAERAVYDEPRKLVAEGLARASTEQTGRRARTVYTITAKGRTEFRRWLGEPSASPALESEAILRTMFAEQATKDQVTATIEGLRRFAQDFQAQLLDQAQGYLDADGGPFPDRLHVIGLAGRFVHEYTAALERWARWAQAEVAGWEGTASAEHGERILREIIRDFGR
jgi:DNA-binding PadR family transcriptional regulator